MKQSVKISSKFASRSRIENIKTLHHPNPNKKEEKAIEGTRMNSPSTFLTSRTCKGVCQRILPVEDFDVLRIENAKVPIRADCCKFCKRISKIATRCKTKEEIVMKTWKNQRGKCKFCQAMMEGGGKVFTDKSRQRFLCFVCKNCYLCGKAVEFDPENIKQALHTIFEEKSKIRDEEDS